MGQCPGCKEWNTFAEELIKAPASAPAKGASLSSGGKTAALSEISMTSEEKIFTGIAEARSKLLAAQGPQQKAEASAAVTGSLGRLLAVAENYPELKANENFIRLQDELAGTENRIAVARGRYNKSVKAFNRDIRQFPGSLFAPGMGLEKREYFEPPAGHAAVEKAPEVKF